MIIIGIDPGLNGAIAVLENNKVLNIFDVPVMPEGKKNKRQINSAQLVKMLEEIIKNLDKNEVTVMIIRYTWRKKNLLALLSHANSLF